MMQRCAVCLTARIRAAWSLQPILKRGIRLSYAAQTITRRGAFEKEALALQEKSKDVQADHDKIFTHDEIMTLRNNGKEREAFFLAIELYLARHSATRRGHVEFIEACMRNMESFKVHRDLDAYKRLLDIFPPDELRATTFWQFEFKHYPKQQDCAMDILEKMHFAGVLPDDDVGRKLVRVFGRYSYAVKRFQRQMYWLPKFANADPYFVPDDLLAKYPFVDGAYIALAALRRANPDDNIELFLHRLGSNQDSQGSRTAEADQSATSGGKESESTPFIAYAQSAEQRVILEQYAHFAHASARGQKEASNDESADVTKQNARVNDGDKKSKLRPLFVDGTFTLWFNQTRLRYFTLSCAPSTGKLEKWAQLSSAPNDYSQPVQDTFEWTTVFNLADRLNEAKVHAQIDSAAASATSHSSGNTSRPGKLPDSQQKSKSAKETPLKMDPEFNFDPRVDTSRRTLGSASVLRAHPDPFDAKLNEAARQKALRNVQEMPIERVAQLFPEYAPSVHEQPDMTVLSMCILDETSSTTLESSKARLASWIKLLETQNPALRDLHVVFRLRDADADVEDGSETDKNSNVSSTALSTEERGAKLDEREWRT